jgi:hypothetical protein
VSKGGLLIEAMAWILQDERYLQWINGSGVDLLWVRGGAGKGKTMISIGLIEALEKSSQALNGNHAIVIYFFCQNADQQLNTAESVLKGLIQCLFEQSQESQWALRQLWDNENQRPSQRVVLLQELWDIFKSMIERFRGQMMYIIIDALDECKTTGLENLLKLVAHDGPGSRANVKWLLTSRPLKEAANTLLPGDEKVQLDLEIESSGTRQAIQKYISRKVTDLDHLHNYGPALWQRMHDRLKEKAENTFLWVSLACQQLEDVLAKDALSTLDELPSGLHELYAQAFNKLRDNDVDVADSCMRLLRVMMLAFRPLHLEEMRSVVGWRHEAIIDERIVQHCSTFIRKREGSIEFVHQSARDFLGRIEKDSKADSFSRYGHGDMAVNAVTFLTQHLNLNIMKLPWPPTTQAIEKAQETVEQHEIICGLAYAAIFWVQHLVEISPSDKSKIEQSYVKPVDTLLRSKALEWFECLSLLRSLNRGVEGLKQIVRLIGDSKVSLRHYYDRRM